jgi:uncharacterized membrane protein YhaH (DUF805 family)
MTFMDAVKTCFSKYADFGGAASRSEYWWFFLFNFVVSLVLQAAFGKLGMVFSLVTLLPGLAVSVRRLHDTDRSGWWLLLSFVPLIGGIVVLVFLCQDTRPNRYLPSNVNYA